MGPMTVPNILFFIPQGTEAAERLESVAGALNMVAHVDIFRSLDMLRLRLQYGMGEPPVIVVLLAPTRSDLHELAQVGNTFFDRRVVLILPDGEDETIATGHGLRPRFVSYSGDFPEIEPVLRKMIGEALPA